MYELEVQAETLLEKNLVSKSDVADLEVFIETKKQELELSEFIREWKNIIESVKTKWSSFTSNVSL